MEYACHPDINAALVVLCDGLKIEVFDREVSLVEPILHVARRDLVRDFDKLRLLLDPWQVWFFQKRRVVRLIDKVFDKEFNLQRVEEFRRLLDDRLASKRLIFLENGRKYPKIDGDEEQERISAAPIEDLVDAHMFFIHSMPTTQVLLENLVKKSIPNSFQVAFKIFPDHPRDANDTFFSHACTFLMALAERRKTLEWMPAWLSPGAQGNADLEAATKRLIRFCLTYFEEDEARRTILLAAAAFRRLLKVLLMSNEAQWQLAEAQHYIQRYETPEFTWRQFAGSPQGHALGQLNAMSLMATWRFVRACQTEHRVFKTEIAKLQLREIWKAEMAMLSAITDYPKLADERGLGEMFPTEWSCVTYDNLGHTTLCLLPAFPKWRSYILEVHNEEVALLAKMGSWAAREMLGIAIGDPVEPPDDQLIADRFFFGDAEMFSALRAKYRG